VAGLTALQALRDHGGLERGGRLLIIGASGGVGTFAVQIAKALGADVTGVSSTSKLDLVRSLGADHVIDFTKVDYTQAPERYDWILDTDSHHSVLACRRALRPHGRYLTLGGGSFATLAVMLAGSIVSAATDRKSGLMLWWRPFDPDDVASLTGLVADGTLTPAIDRRYPLSEVVEALRHVDDGRSRGKVLVIP
jgi:NADPH:quinone reductase-like Zn-dependent oxidoreductase